MSFADAQRSAFDDLLAENGQTIQYAGNDVEALVRFGEDPQRSGSKSVVTRAEIKVRVIDVAAPGYGDVVTISGQSWKVDRPAESNQICHRIELSENERPVI